MENKDTLLSNYNYEIPQELIAQVPAQKRDSSKLIVLNRKTKTIQHYIFSDVVNLLNEGDCLVINTTKVIPARLYGKKKTGGKVEVMFLEPVDKQPKQKVLLKPYIKTGDKIFFDNGYEAVVTDNSDEKVKIIEFNKEDIFNMLEVNGFMPLPPYIKRKDNLAQQMSSLDRQRYQTVYANTEGAIAAPTAGLHFTKEILEKLKQKKVQIAEIILHVGWGTFKPIEVDKIAQHKMLPEAYFVSEEAAKKINNAIALKNRVIAVGTTTVRTLETIANSNAVKDKNDNIVKIAACSGKTDIFIYPGYKFKIVNAMFTNLHLPCSTPLMMASAFAGREFILSAYKQAIEKKYRFFSYGDSMFIQ